MADGAQRVLVVGSINVDLTVRGPRRPRPGETLAGTDFAMSPGGKGANQAVQAARLGARVTLVGRVGDDPFAELVRRPLEAAGVELELTVDPAGTGIASIFVDEAGENSIVVVARANHAFTPEGVVQALGSRCRWDLLLCQGEIPVAAVAAALERARGWRIPCILNPAPADERLRAVMGLADLITPNEWEARTLSGLDTDDPRALALALRDRGARQVVITLGERGALYLEGDRAVLVPPPAVTPVDTTGAGDAFNGALAWALAGGRDLAQSVAWANAAGALAATRPGAMSAMADRREIQAAVAKTSPAG